MIKNYLSILVLLCILLYAFPTIAQDNADTRFPCNLETLKKAVDVYIDALGKIKSGSETDTVKIANSLQEMANVANLMRASCDNLAFKGTKQTVVGPVEIPKGIYRTILETKSTHYIGTEITVVDGECGGGSYGTDTLLFNTGGDSFKDSAEIIFQSKGCMVLIQVNIEDAWNLHFDRVTTS